MAADNVIVVEPPAANAKSTPKPNPADVIAQRFAAGDHVNADVDPNRPSLEYEMEMLRQARIEAAERQQADKKKADLAVKAAETIKSVAKVTSKPQPQPSPEKKIAAEPVRLISATPAPPPTVKQSKKSAQPATHVMPSPAPIVKLEKPQDEVRIQTVQPAPRILERRSRPVAKPASKKVRPLERRTTERSKTAQRTTVATTAAPQNIVSLLMVLASDVTRGTLIDPVVCFGEACFVSSGLTDTAVKIDRTKLLRHHTTRDFANDTCRQKSACVFRGVRFTDGEQMEVFDLASSDKAKLGIAVTIASDETCRATNATLRCASPIATSDFDAWVVPEKTASAAGPDAIELAIADNLPGLQVARSGTSLDK